MASNLLINEPPLQVLPSLALAIGLKEAIMLQQVHYWLNPRFNKNFFEGRYWIHNTFEQWGKQFPFWSERTLQRVTANLEEAGYIISFATREFKKTKYYTINYDRLNQIYLEEAPESKSSQTLIKQGFPSYRQNGGIDTDTLAGSTPCTEDENTKINMLNQSINTSGHPDGIDTDNLTASILPACRRQSRHSDGKEFYFKEGFRHKI